MSTIITYEELQNFIKSNPETWQDIKFQETDFHKISLNDLSIIHTIFYHCNFTFCDFRDINFFNVKFIACTFHDCLINNCYINTATIFENEIHDLEMADMRFIFTSFNHNNFYNCSITYSNFYNCDFYTEYYAKSCTQSHIRFYGVTEITNMKPNNFFNNIPMACPEVGSFIGWKKCCVLNSISTPCIVKLEIPEDAIRSSGGSQKCRANKAKILEIQDLEGNKLNMNVARSFYDSNFIYTIGETVEVKNFDTNRFNVCAPGIHFFITRKEAVDYEV